MRVLVTGGTGSLGRAIIKHLLPTAERLVCLSTDEFKQAMFKEQVGVQPTLRFLIGNVRDKDRLIRAFHHIDLVIHTAALKWISDGVYNIDEIVKTNVVGTMNVIEAAIEAGVGKVLLISSDKGCHAANAYGASKFMAEQYAVQANSFAFPRGTLVSCVRYGNVMWSRGSVMHRFRAAWQQHRPLWVTHADMSRFGIRMSEAVEFVMWASSQMRGGEIFVPDLPSFKVTDCAAAVANAVPTAVGLRPGGEKLHEMLVTEEESLHAFYLGKKWVIEPEIMSWNRPRWQGDPIPHGWSFTSDKNSRWLSVTDLRGTWSEMDEGLPSV